MKTLLEKNIMIANFLGWEVTENRHDRLKNKEMQSAEIPDGFFKIHKDDLHFDKSMDLLMRALIKIHEKHLKQGIEGRDLIYAIQVLLGGGYRFGPDICYEKEEFSVENLFERIVLFLENNLKQ